MKTTKAIIVASAVLHNIGIQTGVDMDEELRDVEADIEHENEDINVLDDAPAMQSNNAAM